MEYVQITKIEFKQDGFQFGCFYILKMLMFERERGGGAWSSGTQKRLLKH